MAECTFSPRIMPAPQYLAPAAPDMRAAERLVRDGLAACVQIDGPVCSTYIWKGRPETATEWRCTCKTTAARSAACAAAIAAGHAYETPEIIVAPITASTAYAAWVAASVAADGGQPGAGRE